MTETTNMNRKLLTTTLLLALSGAASADEGRHSGRILDALDKNGDGQVTLDEFHGPQDRLFEAADADRNGVVTLDEMHTHRDQMKAEREAQMADRMARHASEMDEAFLAMDTDGDGGVAPEEARVAAFHRMDKDGDGILTAAELRRRPHRGHGGPGREGRDRPDFGRHHPAPNGH